MTVIAIRKMMLRFNRHARRHESSGQALAELAIALPVLLLMLVGIFEFARAYQIQQVVVNAAREGARQAVLQDVTTDSATAVVDGYLISGGVTTQTVVVTNAEAGTGLPVTVQVSVPYSFALIGPLIRLASRDSGRTGPGDITLSSQATMRHE